MDVCHYKTSNKGCNEFIRRLLLWRDLLVDERAAGGERARRDLLQRVLSVRGALQRRAGDVSPDAQDHGERCSREVGKYFIIRVCN